MNGEEDIEAPQQRAKDCLKEHGGSHDWMTSNQTAYMIHECRWCGWRYTQSSDPLNGKTKPPTS
jgi:hypothetical protein